MNTERFNGRVVLVTGAASGIGAEAAARFAAEGADVVLLDIDDDRGNAVAHETGGRYLHCDVAAAADWDTVATSVHEQYGRVDVVFSNGPGRIVRTVAVHELTEDEWDRQIAVTLKAAYLAARTFCPSLGRTQGSLIFTSSVHAGIGVRGCAAYAAAKGGLLALTRQLAVEYAPAVRVNAVVPGPVRTPAWDGIDSAGVAATIAETPAGRLGDPADIAAAVAYLASPDASFVTGSTLTVDGGWTISTTSS
ncbi:SDR family oxidoreductase [Dactylosporangium aurantiacum]|uniref:SDR family oxidoreductase n=1 Tax=Dactylosporangium aurantiacum TaxID=35754 RepID=A0A9Q9ITM6_9ACTN|nr:SDR family oxidoreductase [Dactylosporangium aurantiacum]MDG6107652.1 SDR family oxidoreductase [Dactylosporangium aurantiacum]UWZ58753.1 SDR family oxidoreductase [Dactylosporangium aurantiacum]